MAVADLLIGPGTLARQLSRSPGYEGPADVRTHTKSRCGRLYGSWLGFPPTSRCWASRPYQTKTPPTLVRRGSLKPAARSFTQQEPPYGATYSRTVARVLSPSASYMWLVTST